MKHIILVFTIFLSLSTHGDTLTVDDLAGYWPSHKDLTPDGVSMTLTIEKNGFVTFKRNRGDKIISDLKTSFDHISVFQDIIIIPFFDDSNEVSFKLVLSGWKNISGAMLYGTMIVYKWGEQQTGAPITFFRDDS
jgi:hypothetical protein